MVKELLGVFWTTCAQFFSGELCHLSHHSIGQKQSYSPGISASKVRKQTKACFYEIPPLSLPVFVSPTYELSGHGRTKQQQTDRWASLFSFQFRLKRQPASRALFPRPRRRKCLSAKVFLHHLFSSPASLYLRLLAFFSWPFLVASRWVRPGQHFLRTLAKLSPRKSTWAKRETGPALRTCICEF